MSTLTFYFDFISPYAYLASRWVPQMCDELGLELELAPTIFGVLLSHHGHLGPAEIPSKREWVFRDILRTAARDSVAIAQPALHPFNSVKALRLVLPEVAGGQQLEVCETLWAATWRDGRDVSTAEGLVGVLDDAGFDGSSMLERTAQEDVKAALRARMEQALEIGVFGVPTFVVDGELFWGNDQRGFIERFVKHGRAYDQGQLDAFLGTPFGVRRQR